MITINEKNFKDYIESVDSKDYFINKKLPATEIKDFEYEINKYIKDNIVYKKKAILGLDIYQYSQYCLEKQTMIPLILNLLMNQTLEWCNNHENIVFDNYSFSKNFIHTGDGGFLIFDNLIQAFIFNINFYTVLNLFNTEHFFPKLKSFIGRITCRSCITFDKIFQFEKNWFGPGIIVNARILSKDKLNRFLIDENTNDWFSEKINGIESLSILSGRDILSILNRNAGKYISAIFSQEHGGPIQNMNNNNLIMSCHSLKIGEIKAKKDSLSVYNLEIQRIAEISDEVDPEKKIQFIVSIGNLNTNGIE